MHGRLRGGGKHQAGNYSDAELAILERVACPSAGACGGQFTANTMVCVFRSHRPRAAELVGRTGAGGGGGGGPLKTRRPGRYGEASGPR